MAIKFDIRCPQVTTTIICAAALVSLIAGSARRWQSPGRSPLRLVEPHGVAAGTRGP